MKHSNEFSTLVSAARNGVKEISIEQVPDRISKGAILIDVREDLEWQTGHIAGAKHLGRGIIERDIVQEIP